MVIMSYPKEIQTFFESIVKEVNEVLDPEYILIAGSFGKGSWLYSDSKLLSDFEFVFVCKKRWSLGKKKILLKKLNQKYEYDISLKGYLLNNVQNRVISNYSKRSFGYVDLNFFDTFSKPQILYSKKDSISSFPKLSNSEVPAWEAWRLYVNRIGDLISLSIENKSKLQEKYFWLKFFESTADAYLLVNNMYSKNINDRFNVFTNELFRKDNVLNPVCVDSYKWLNNALDSRKKHDLSIFNINELTNKERYYIVNAWLKYFEDKVCVEENFDETCSNFSENYINNIELQKKYLELDNIFAIQLSNALRVIAKFHKLKKLNIRFNKINFSWRHLSLFAVSETFKCRSTNDNDFIKPKKVLSRLIMNKQIQQMTEKELLSLVYNLWKNLR